MQEDNTFCAPTIWSFLFASTRHAGIVMNAVVLLQAAGVTPGSAAEAVVAVSGAQEREHWEANAQRWELLRNHCTNVENSKRTCALCSVFYGW